MKNFSKIKFILLSSLIFFSAFVFAACNQDGANSEKDKNDTIVFDINNKYLVGRSNFEFWYYNPQTNQPESGQNLTIKSKMTMTYDSATLDHYCPVDIITDNNNGSYNTNIYFTMPTYDSSNMKNGDWSIDIFQNNVLIKTFPVIVEGSENSYGILKGTNDFIISSGMIDKRTYYIFEREFFFGCHSQLQFYVTTISTDNKNYLPLFTGQVLTDQNKKEWMVQSVAVQVALDTPDNWVTFNENLEQRGYFYIINYPNYTDQKVSQYYIKLFINGEQKTLNGDIVKPGINDYITIYK